jgi:hypothetical protein
MERKLGVKARSLEAVASGTVDSIREMARLFTATAGGNR